MPRYDKLRKTERDGTIRSFAHSHRTWSHAEIAVQFGLSRSVITRILNAAQKRKRKGGTNDKV